MGQCAGVNISSIFIISANWIWCKNKSTKQVIPKTHSVTFTQKIMFRKFRIHMITQAFASLHLETVQYHSNILSPFPRLIGSIHTVASNNVLAFHPRRYRNPGRMGSCPKNGWDIFHLQNKGKAEMNGDSVKLKTIMLRFQPLNFGGVK